MREGRVGEVHWPGPQASKGPRAAAEPPRPAPPPPACRARLCHVVEQRQVGVLACAKGLHQLVNVGDAFGGGHRTAAGAALSKAVKAHTGGTIPQALSSRPHRHKP
jgi:hypothetical protein